MNFTSYLLNGAWEMYYQAEKYTKTESPLKGYEAADKDAAGTEPEDMSSQVIECAVPGYWEDMTEAFSGTPFFRELRVNPEYGVQQYPMAGAPPDMALPNIMGNFWYRRGFDWNGANQEEQIVYLHFEGVQNTVAAWINDVYLGSHEGYSTPFDLLVPAEILQKGITKICRFLK